MKTRKMHIFLNFLSFLYIPIDPFFGAQKRFHDLTREGRGAGGRRAAPAAPPAACPGLPRGARALRPTHRAASLSVFRTKRDR